MAYTGQDLVDQVRAGLKQCHGFERIDLDRCRNGRKSKQVQF